MFRPLAAMFCVAICAVPPTAANALVGKDFSKEASDLFCPAQVSRVVPLHQIERPKGEHDLGTDADFAIIMTADRAKNVSGTLKFFSKDRAYSAAFATHIDQAVKLVFEKEGVRNGTKTYYEAPPVFVRLPASVALDAVWIYDIAENGVAASCATLPLTYGEDRKWPRDGGHSERFPSGMDDDAIRRLAADRPLQIAQLTSKIDLHDCPHISVDATAGSLVSPPWPEGAGGNGVVILKIALDAGGRLVDLSVLGSSGTPEFDRAALWAASRSTFKPRQFLCQPIPGYYSFRANFNIGH